MLIYMSESCKFKSFETALLSLRIYNCEGSLGRVCVSSDSHILGGLS